MLLGESNSNTGAFHLKQRYGKVSTDPHKFFSLLKRKTQLQTECSW